MNKPVPGLDSELDTQDVDVLGRKASHRGFMRLDTLRLRHRLHEGGWSAVMEREVLIKNHAVGVLLFDPDRDRVVLVRQFRVGVLAEPGSPWLLELVAGLIDTDEEPEQVALRETREESGLDTSDLIRVSEYYNSPGTSNEKVTLYCGRVDSSVAGGVFGLDHEHEDIQVVVLDLATAIEAVASGSINNAMTIIALQWLQLNRQELTRRWQTAS